MDAFIEQAYGILELGNDKAFGYVFYSCLHFPFFEKKLDENQPVFV